MMIKRVFLLSPILFLLIISCDTSKEESLSGKISLHFQHLVDQEEVQFDRMIYENEAGNQYEVTEIQWFVSDLTLVKDDGEEQLLDEGGFAHYIDTNLPETWHWELPDDIDPGKYKSLKMTFGIKGEKNIPYSFPNPPESDMQWPINLGGENGGYHYMKLNGFWIDEQEARNPFNFHLGVGQERDNEGNITRFVQNWFEVTLPLADFTMQSEEVKMLALQMHIEEWFKNPHTYDHNVYGSRIMMNQEAMRKISENGINVFTIKSEEETNDNKTDL